MNFDLWWRGSATNGATPSSLVSTFLYSISSSAQYDRVGRPWQVQRCLPSQDQETEDPQERVEEEPRAGAGGAELCLRDRVVKDGGGGVEGGQEGQDGSLHWGALKEEQLQA